MDYILCEKPGRLLLKQKEVPKPKPNQALLEVKKVGICGTDIHAYTGNQAYFTYPRILGHELAAKVVEIDDHPTIRPGDKVLVMPYISCGHCIACRQGKTNCCTNVQVLGVHTDGGMQEKIVVRNDSLIETGELSYDEMAIVEPLAIGAHALRRAHLSTGEFAAVIGCGPIGLGIMKLAQIGGAKVIALDINEQRLQFAKEVLGVSYLVNVADDPLSKVREITNNDLATAVFDATGYRKALESGIQYMAHGGRYILVGLSKSNLTFKHPDIHKKEATIMCSRNATVEDFQQIISTLKRKLFPAETYITHKVSYLEMVDQFDSLLKPENAVIKALVDFK